MKIPPEILDPKGQIAKGVVNLKVNGNYVEEYGLTVIGKHSTCYVLVSPGDVITANISINSGVTGQFADLIVDGILRNSRPNTRGSNVFRYTFERASYSGIHLGETKKSSKFARMKVVERNCSKDLPINGKQERSNVGSIKVEIFRREATDNATSGNVPVEASSSGATQHGSGSGSGNGDASGANVTAGDTHTTLALPELGICQREPDFVKYPTWQDLNRYINSDVPAPSFEISFFDGNKQTKFPKARVTKVYTGDHKLWASFTFLLRSTANLRDLGFDDVPLHDSPNPPDTDTYPTIAGQSAENAIEASSSVGQADNSMDALFVDDAEYDAQSPQSVVQSKKAVIRKMSKKASTTEQVEQPKTSTILDNLAKNAKKGKAAAVHATTGGENKLEVESKPKSKPEDNEPETHEEYVARKKAELVISGVKAAPAHQAYLQRAATEEPEEDDDHMEFMPGTSTQSSMPDILPHSIQSVPSTPILHSQRLLGRRSSPPALDLMATPSTSTNQEILTYGLPAFLSTPLSSRQVFSAHLQDARRPSMPTLASSTLSSPCIREVTTHSMPGLTDTIRASTAQVLSMDVQKRRPFDVAMTSDSRPSTLPNREVEIYSVAGLSNSPILNGQPLPIHEAGAGPSLLSMASESSPSTPSNGDILNCMPGLYIAPHPIAQVISATTTLERRPSTQSFRPAVQRLGEPVTRPASRSSKLEAFASGGTFGWDSVSSFAESSRMNSPQASGAVMGPGYKITASNFEISTTSRMLSSELRRTTRPSTPEPTEIQIELPNQPEIEDTHMLGKPRLTSTLPSETQSEVQPQIHPRDFRSLLSIRPSSPAPFEMQVDTTRREEPQTISAIRQSSPVPSETPTETPTETATEVASLDALETSRKSSQRDIAACYNNGCTAFQAASTPNQTFNHTEESPILGSSQRLMAVHEASLMTPVTTQARLHWQNHTPLNEDLPKVQDVQRSFLGQDQEGNITLHSVPSLVVKLKGNPTIHPNPVVQPTHVQLMSPPLSIQKRKADNIGGTDPDLNTPQRKVPSSQDQSVWGHSQFVQENRALQSRQAVRTNSTYQHQKTQRHKMSYFEHRPNREEYELWTGRQGNVQAETEELRERDGAERTNITAAEQQGRENEPHWEEIRRQNEVARARMATAEQQRKELQARYEVAMEVQKERENVHELNKEAERLERENAKLQATIAALYRGDSL